VKVNAVELVAATDGMAPNSEAISPKIAPSAKPRFSLFLIDILYLSSWFTRMIVHPSLKKPNHQPSRRFNLFIKKVYVRMGYLLRF